MKGGTCQTAVVGYDGVTMLLRDPVATLPHHYCTAAAAAAGAVSDPMKARGCEVVVAWLHDADVVCCCTVVLACCAQQQQAARVPVAPELLLRRDAVKLGDVDDDGGRGALRWLRAARLGFADSRKARKAWQGFGC